MAAWVLIPCLVRLRSEFDVIAPDRDRASDGTIGDKAHRQRVSDHNPDETGAVPIRDADRAEEVHAIDVDDDLRTPGLTMEAVVQFLLARCRSGQENRLRYVIYNRRIWEASNGWRQRAYVGDNPHTEHAHFSGSYDTAREADTRSWHLEDTPMALTPEDKQWIKDTVTTIVDLRADALTAAEAPSRDGQRENPVGRAALVQPVPNVFRGTRTPAWVLLDDLAKAVREAIEPMS